MNRNLENKGKGRGYCQKEQFKKDKEQYYKNPKKCKHCDLIVPYKKRVNIFVILLVPHHLIIKE